MFKCHLQSGANNSRIYTISASSSYWGTLHSSHINYIYSRMNFYRGRRLCTPAINLARSRLDTHFVWYLVETISIRFVGWIFGRKVSFHSKNCFQAGTAYTDKDILSDTFYVMFWGFRLGNKILVTYNFLEKVAHCTIIYLLSSEASS